MHLSVGGNVLTLRALLKETIIEEDPKAWAMEDLEKLSCEDQQ